ncbi:hypothetical protein RB595_003656 [Gaeumannomyces hyphopodioides]
MMTSSRPRDVGGSFSSRRGHAPQLSISDPSHHVTEAIGTMYGDSDDESGPDSRRESRQDHLPSPETARKGRPLSFLSSPAGGEQIRSPEGTANVLPEARQKLARSTSEKTMPTLAIPAGDDDVNGLKKSQTLPARAPSKRAGSSDGPASPGPMSPMSPTLSLREVQEAESSQFPLGSIDNPNDIAQELSNLQALRRMSMDVGNNSDPDLLPFSGLSLMAMPTRAPTGEDDAGDLSRLLWVPAKVHPELAPDLFKNFLEDRVKTIKRRSGDSMLSVEGLDRSNSASLRRKKSMLSRQIDSTANSATDDALERLERLRSANGRSGPELSLNELVKDPTRAVQKLAQETQEAAAQGDMPILPVAPGMGLRRSTRTTYRKGGSLRAGDRAPFAKRVAARDAEKDGDKDVDDPAVPPIPGHGLTRVQSEPVSGGETNFSRPTRSVRRQQPFQRDVLSPTSSSATDPEAASSPSAQSHADENPISPGTSLSTQPSAWERPRTSDSSRSAAPSVPQIVETPPPMAEEDDSVSSDQKSSTAPPQRSSSQKSMENQPADQQPPPRSQKRPPSAKSHEPTPTGIPPAVDVSKTQGLENLAQNLTSPPGSGGANRTDSLTFIPTLSPADDKEKRKSKEKDEGESTKSTAWKWFRGEDREKKKKEKEEQAKKARSRTSAEKGHDNARLDVLQNSIDNALQRGRESLLLDRDSAENKLHDERKKESGRKSGEGKKEKDGFFGSIFGSKKTKGDKDGGGDSKSSLGGGGGRGKQRALSPEPPPRQLVPDVDYHYTRFPIVEERAIYRMAHIKLANPRRSLLSQVLLSNFMYSYLAKVQAMHPQLNVPVSPQQKRQEEERKRREQEQQQQQQQQQQQYLLEQQQLQEAEQDGGQNSFDQYNFDYHRSSNQYGDPQQQNDSSLDYIDDSQIYEYEQQQRDGAGQHGRGDQNDGQGGRKGRQYYEYEQQEDGRRRDDDMW